jgi:acetyl-CoA synthetase
VSTDPQSDRWQRFVAEVRRQPERPFEEQWAEFSAAFADRDPALPPPPAWLPAGTHLERSNVARFMRERDFSSYPELHRWSVDHRASFWRAVVDRLGIAFATPPTTTLDLGDGPRHPHWLPGARLNIVESCFQAESDSPAIIAGDEGRESFTTWTYGELERQVKRVAAGLLRHGFGAGDAIAIYMPMNPECVAAYLGIVRAGCVVVSIADSFAAPEVAKRLEISSAVGIITVDAYVRGKRRIGLYTTVREAGAPRAVVLQQTDDETMDLRPGDLSWSDLIAGKDSIETPTAAPNSITNVLFSSGTTGDPKAIPWTHLTPIKCAMDGHFHQDIRPGDVVCWPTNIGWMMGPWLIYASLMNRATIALYQSVPSGRGFAEFVERAEVSVLGVVPSLVRAWRESGAVEHADWSRIRLFSSTGEPSNRYDYLWLMSRARYRAPVIEYCGGTEIGGGYLTGTVLQAASPATFSTPALGLELVILDQDHRKVVDGQEGEVFLVPPSIGLSQTLLNRDHEAEYHQGCPPGPEGEALRRHGDQVARLPGDYFQAQGRADDTMNLGGIKVSSLELERVIQHHPAVSEAAAVAVQPHGEGAEQLVIFAVLHDEIEVEGLRQELGRTIATELNPLFKIADLVVATTLPRTASGKLMRRELRRRYRPDSKN